MHGVWAGASKDHPQWLAVRSLASGIVLTLEDNHHAPVMTPEQARYLARKLYRLARQHDLREMEKTNV